MIEAPLYTVLSSASAITAIAANRIYPVEVPQDPILPAVSYKIIAATTSPTFSTRGMTKYRIEVDSWGATYSDAVGLRDAVVATLNGYTDKNMTIDLLMPRDFYERDLLQYRAMAEFYILSDL